MTMLPRLLMMMMFGSRFLAIVCPPRRMLKNVKIVKNSTTIQNNKCPRRKCRKKEVYYISFVPGRDRPVRRPGASICSLSSEINDVALWGTGGI